VGFSWDTFGNQKMVVRGGFGVAYDRIYNNIFENLRFNPPFFSDDNFGLFGANNAPAGALATPGFYAIPSTANQNGLLLDPTIFPGGLPKASPRHMDQNLVTPYYEQMHFGIQYELSKDMVLETDYIGTLGRKLLGILNANIRWPHCMPHVWSPVYSGHALWQCRLCKRVQLKAHKYYHWQ